MFRLVGKRNWYFDENNVLCYCYQGDNPERSPKIQVDAPNIWYTLVLSYIKTEEIQRGNLYFGRKGEALSLLGSGVYNPIFDLDTKNVAMSNFEFGYCSSPTAGYLTGGQFGNIRFWNRTLTDAECRLVDVDQDAAMSEDDLPLGAPAGVKWNYYPLDGNAFSTKSTIMTPSVQNTSLSGWTLSSDRYNAKLGAVTSTGSGKVTISNFQDIFGSSEYDATYSFWINVAQAPSSDVTIFQRETYNTSSSSCGNYLVSLTSGGNLKFSGAGTTTTTFPTALSVNEWHHVTVVGKSGKSVQFFVDGREIGNMPSELTLGYYRFLNYNNANYYYPTFTLGGWNGAADGLTFFHSALTSTQVRELYERQRPQKVVHTVTQGVQIPKLNKSRVTAPAEGCVESVALTVAQSVQWTAQSNSSWIQITGDAEGAGSANVAFTVGANPAVTSRTGSITVAGKNVAVVQEGLRASVSCDDTSFGVESDSGTIWVETEGGGTWTASADVDWIHLFDESGTGTTPVIFVVDDYTTTTASRSGTVTIAGHKVVITQQGYELSIDPAVAEVGSNAGAGQFGVSAPIDAVWEAIADCDWITIIGARTGIGDGVIQYTIADNLTGETRTGRIVIAGKTYTITQKTTLPLTTAVVGSGSVSGAGNYNQGSRVTLRATPASGYVFTHWSGDAVGVTNAVEISVDSPKEVTAHFIPEGAAQRLAEEKAAQGGFYTRDQIHNMEIGNLLFDVDSDTGKARIGVHLQETSDLAHPNWKPVSVTAHDLDIGADGSVGIKAPATGNAKFFRVVSGE